MRADQIWKAAVGDAAGFLDELIDLLRGQQIQFCVIGDHGVNTYVDPLIGLDLDLVIAAQQIENVESVVTTRFQVQRFSHSLNISAQGSNLRVQIQIDPCYFGFTDRAGPSKRCKDLLDIQRLVESHPELRDLVPVEILEKLSEK